MPRNAKLPTLKLNAKAQDNRLRVTKTQNMQLQLLPDTGAMSCMGQDSVINFICAAEQPANSNTRGNSSKTGMQPLAALPPACQAEVKALPKEVQARLATVHTPHHKSVHQLMMDKVSSLPMGLALSKGTIRTYASYVLSFLSWFEWYRNTKVALDTRYPLFDVFCFAKHLIKAEYNSPLTYYNVVVHTLSQSYRNDGQRLLITDHLAQTDLESHRATLERYVRKYAPDQAPLIYQQTIMSPSVTQQSTAVLLLWVFLAARYSSMQGLCYLKSYSADGLETSAVFTASHLKGSASDVHEMTVYCNCLVPGAQGSQFCALHSSFFSYHRISFPVLKHVLDDAIKQAGVLSHSPRVTAAVLIKNAQITCDAYNTSFHQIWINNFFYWAGKQDTMFKYYTRSHAKISAHPALPMHALFRACKMEGWNNEVIVNTLKKTTVAAPHHMMEILQSDGFQPPF